MRIGKSSGLILALACAFTTTGEPIKKIERQRLVAHLEMTQGWLLDEVAGLSAAQVQFHPAPGVWSVVDVVEHLRLAEPIYWQQFKDAVKAAPSDAKPLATDADILWYGIDRTERQKTEAVKSPQEGKPIDLAKGLDAFRKLHGEIVEYARTTDQELHRHLIPEEGVDAYQWILEMSAHTQRHILQIREVKANANFPKK
jgi:hypothetical protein